MPTKTCWMTNLISKKVKVKHLIFRLIVKSFRELTCVRKLKVHCLGNFPLQSHSVRKLIVDKVCGLWTGTALSAPGHLSSKVEFSLDFAFVLFITSFSILQVAFTSDLDSTNFLS